MRKFFLGAALVAASFGMAQPADAATVMDVDGVSTVLAISDYEGTYNGTMDQIKMRGEDYEPRTASYTLEGGLYSPYPMGKKPLSCRQGCYAAKNTPGMQPTARKQNYPNRLNRF